jgi:phosphatidylethanolamine/phosphatidyl-N-methylethanolamine N-methyltransferase
MESAEDYYQYHYQKITNSGPIGFVAMIGHLSLEKWPFTKFSKDCKKNFDKILEVGAGHGQHYKYLKEDFKAYTMTDVRPNLLNNLKVSDARVVIEKTSIDAESLPYADNSFDRLIATCLLVHLDNPEKALTEWRRVVKPGGAISIYIPCEPGILLRILQSITTRRKQKKLGIDARYLHYGEHRYNFPFVIAIISNVFRRNFRIRKFPFLFGSFDFNLWSVVTISNVK